MAGNDPADEIAALKSTLASIKAVLDPDAMATEAASLREQAADPELWADQDRAQKVTRRLSYLEAELTRLSGLDQRLADTAVLFDLAESENDEPTRNKVRALSEKHGGPILFSPGNGKRPSVGKSELLAWVDLLQDAVNRRVEERDLAARSAKLTAGDTHAYGRTGTAAPGVGGHVRKTRKSK